MECNCFTELDQVLEQAERIRSASIHADADGLLAGFFTLAGDFVFYKPQQPGEYGPPVPIGIVSRGVMG